MPNELPRSLSTARPRSPLLLQPTWRVERTIPTSDLDRHVTRQFLCMDDGRGRTTFIRTPAMASSSRAPYGVLEVIYLVVNEPGGSGFTSSDAATTWCNRRRASGVRYRARSMAASVVCEGPFIVIYPFSFHSSFQLLSLLSDSVPLLRNMPKNISFSLLMITNYRHSFGFKFYLFLGNGTLTKVHL
ncbi:hypothetical protein OG21DRAFT_1482279 [Imleria badia]|nr:hypothetical protein OG21DRAFT_1482279 [Imleria badia]